MSTVKQDEWSAERNFGEGNFAHTFEVKPELVGGITLRDFFDDGGLIVAYGEVDSQAPYYSAKTLPYMYQRMVNGSPVGVKIEFIVRSHHLCIAKTEFGWDSKGMSLVEIPESLRFRLTLIDSDMATHLQRHIDINDPKALGAYLRASGLDRE